jgi:hypothetical protein
MVRALWAAAALCACTLVAAAWLPQPPAGAGGLTAAAAAGESLAQVASGAGADAGALRSAAAAVTGSSFIAPGAAQPASSPSPTPPQTAPGATPSQEQSAPPVPVPAGSQAPATPSPPASPSLAPEASPSAPTMITPPPVSPSPEPVVLGQTSLTMILGRSVSVPVTSPPSGILTLSGFDPQIVQAVFNPISRTIDVAAQHLGSTTITATDMYGLSATLTVTVQAYAGKAYASTSITITGNPASADFVAESAATAATLVAYPQPGALVHADPADVRGAIPLWPDNELHVTAPLTIAGPGYAPYHQDVAVTVINLAQPELPPKNLLVSDYPETIAENGTLFYADVSFDQPARLLYYHYANPGSQLRRVLVKAQNNGLTSSYLHMIAGIAGPSPDILAVGHEATKRFLVNDLAAQGQVFEVPPHATINVVNQLLPGGDLVSGLMQLRVLAGSDVRVAVVVQDASEIPVEPISETLLSSAVKHARGVYEVPDFYYDVAYTVGQDPASLVIGKIPLPNAVQGEVLGGDYGVKQAATLTMLNPFPSPARVGMWFEPRGGTATGTFLLDGDLVELHPVRAGSVVLVRTFDVPPQGYRRVNLVTMPEGGSSYPVVVWFSSQPPPGASWNVSPAVYAKRR